jgi:hypothetical protein
MICSASSHLSWAIWRMKKMDQPRNIAAPTDLMAQRWECITRCVMVVPIYRHALKILDPSALNAPEPAVANPA